MRTTRVFDQRVSWVATSTSGAAPPAYEEALLHQAPDHAPAAVVCAQVIICINHVYSAIHIAPRAPQSLGSAPQALRAVKESWG